MNTIAVDTLMAQTRRLAALYRQATGQTLPVSAELGRYDAALLLHLEPLASPCKGIDFIGSTGPYKNKTIQVKSRVIFDEQSKGSRVGQLNGEMLWDFVILVLYTADYEPFAIYGAPKEEIAIVLNEQSSRRNRGAMSLAKFKAISQLLWTIERGLEWDEIWTNQA